MKVYSPYFHNPRKGKELKSQHEAEDISTTPHMQLHRNTTTSKSSTAGVSTIKSSSSISGVGPITQHIQGCSKQFLGGLA